MKQQFQKYQYIENFRILEVFLVRAECVRQCNEVAIILGIISILSLWANPRRVPKLCMGS